MDEEFARRRKWFEEYFSKIEKGLITSGPERIYYTCPCCGYPTLSERGGYEICVLCGWEDEGFDDPEADSLGGPNYYLTLTEARQNFKKYLTKHRPDMEPGYYRDHPQRHEIEEMKRQLMNLYSQIMTEPNLNKHIDLWNHDMQLTNKILDVLLYGK